MTNVTRLPGPIAGVWDWQRRGLCRDRDSAQFFHPEGERPGGGAKSRPRRSASPARFATSAPRTRCARMSHTESGAA